MRRPFTDSLSRPLLAFCVTLFVSACGSIPLPNPLGGGAAPQDAAPQAEREVAATVADGAQSPALVADGLRPEVMIPTPNLNPHTRTVYERALALAQAGEYAAADALFLELSEDQPELAGPWVNLGLSAKRQGDMHQAESYFRAALKANAYNCDALTELGLIARRIGQFGEAEVAYHKCLKANPGYARAHLNLGILYELYLGDLAAALAAYHDYQELVSEPDARVAGWIADIERRVASIAAR